MPDEPFPTADLRAAVGVDPVRFLGGAFVSPTVRASKTMASLDCANRLMIGTATRRPRVARTSSSGSWSEERVAAHLLT